MRIVLALVRRALCAVAPIAFMAGCGGSQPPIEMPSVAAQGRSIGNQASNGGSWMLPETKNEDMLYVAGSYLWVYSYPSGNPIGAIAVDGPVNSVCSDRSGNVFAVIPSYAEIVEFAHGSLTRSATLHFHDNKVQPAFCAVDPHTENLAATIASKRAGVAIFTGEKEPPTFHYVHKFNEELWDCTYDTASNLFVSVSSGKSLLAELPKGGSSFVDLKLKGSSGFEAPPPVKWDGSYVTVANQTGSDKSTLYRLKLNGTSLSVVGKTTLNAYGVRSMWFEPRTLIATSSAGVSLWKYPTGGYPFLTIQGTTAGAGVTVSLAPK